MDHPTRNAYHVALRWAPLVVWLSLVVLAAPAVGATLADRSRALQVLGTAAAWGWWAAGLFALLLPSTASLTAVRMSAPMGILASAWAGLAGGPTAGQLALALAGTVAATVFAFNSELGRRFAQASAYGDESRFPLRPPGALLAGPIPLFWLSAAIPVLAGPMLLASRAWLVGAAVTAFAGWWTWVVARRFHRLSRRWLVFVPAGVVVHDQVVLAETAMFGRTTVAGCELALATTEAADLTGNAPGMAIEFRLSNAGDKIVLAATREHPEGRALHVRSFFVSPSLPGAALREARRRGIPGFGTTD